ncbi:nucleotidyltransferase family protein [Bergeyella cardium]|uniref:NTP transferase domain-containing protein n=1 Tax=Bergeyella cardium TaxID=1585976 RepID=A0A6P1QTY3_9FLAO|nr:sugar phosphate nucleotidyltransferase [Bergeyella cardium]QHN65259.1 NTP transferase domain-containing protein [Bergeyella cardium]WHE32833.1 sugar phosphate nucleotidyltransferase [Bergeyella cardium]WHF59486.1 sugar phosphate nucleotidyltransferase [Bergeyella cardium]
MKVLIFAAGKGTRLRPFTDHHPKALAKVNGIPLLERNIKFLQGFGINDFVINIHHFGGQIIEFLQANHHFNANIQISDEREELLETGGGLIFAKKFLEQEQNFLIMNADILTDLDISALIDAHIGSGSLATLAVSERNSSRKLLFNAQMLLKGWRNTQTGEERLADEGEALEELAFSGIHCVSGEIFAKITRRGKFSIMEEYLDLMHTERIQAYKHNACIVDVGRPESIIEAEKYFQ